ncbi:GPO family capsid scaffolding protein [Kiloniella sp. b19]|uniref:GPO family capsid scaffolding protein n=1 Tax=Kiloniella sp. GXU_MW_B19 TaxID=3141326 RepID=UPI0031D9A29A
MADKLKFFRVAQSGKTVDGRTITPEQIQQMADSYDPKVYGARINMEHIRGFGIDGPFKAYGDVLELKTEKHENGTDLYLLAALNPTEALKAINKDRQKVYSSVEIHPNFPETEGAYLVGLAMTDSPASRGTELIKFNLEKRDQFEIQNEYSELLEMDIDALKEETEDKGPSLLSRVKGLLSKSDKKNDAHFTDIHQAVEAIAEDQTNRFSAVEGDVSTLSQTVKDQAEAIKSLTAKIQTLEGQAAKPQQSYTPRPEADGAGEVVQAEC